MYTDESEISISRELNLCLNVVEKTRSSLEQREQQFGMEFEQAVIAAAENRLRISPQELAQWQSEAATLPRLEQRLQRYRVTLEIMQRPIS